MDCPMDQKTVRKLDKLFAGAFLAEFVGSRPTGKQQQEQD